MQEKYILGSGYIYILRYLSLFLLVSRFRAWNKCFFYSILTFSYTKYFVHSYTLDVVFTLSSNIYVYHVILFHWRIVSCNGCWLIGFAVWHSGCPTRCKQHVACCHTLVAKWEISPQWHACDMSFHTLFIAFVSDYFKHFKNHCVSPAQICGLRTSAPRKIKPQDSYKVDITAVQILWKGHWPNFNLIYISRHDMVVSV